MPGSRRGAKSFNSIFSPPPTCARKLCVIFGRAAGDESSTQLVSDPSHNRPNKLCVPARFQTDHCARRYARVSGDFPSIASIALPSSSTVPAWKQIGNLASLITS
jgi:hypothetical protein